LKTDKEEFNLKIKPLKKEDFDKIFEIMEEAFPKAEYRPKEKQYALLDNPLYTVSVLSKTDIPIGFIASWELDNCIFIEHFAVKSEYRGQGLGADFLKTFLSVQEKPTVLEVEDLKTPVALRRIAFYERLGFTLSDTGYIQPNLSPTRDEVPLRIMNFGTAVKAKEQIFKTVYNKEVI